MSPLDTDLSKSPLPGGPTRKGMVPAQPARARTFVAGTVDRPVIGFQVGRPGCLHQQVLDVPPGQLAAAMIQRQTAVARTGH